MLAAVCLSLASPAAAKPAITWVDGPVFPKSGPPPGRTTFVVHGPVDVSALQDDFVSAFGGDAAAGQAYFATALTQCLSGARVLGEPPHGILRDERHRLGWAFPSTVTQDRGTWAISWTESSKADSPRLDGADSLSVALARTGADWLVVIDDLVATLTPGKPSTAWLTPPGFLRRVEGSKLPVATLAARVVVLGAHPFGATILLPEWSAAQPPPFLVKDVSIR